jgi:hypothetical protein
MVGGDFIFTLSSSEVWGDDARKDTLEKYFKYKLEEMVLVDVDHIQMIPNWRNNRIGEDGVSKRFDRFIASENILMEV